MPANGLARRPARGGSVTHGRPSRLGLAALLLLLFVLPAAASAYTLVLRSGRRVTIPDDFKVTPAAVIYEASPGFSVTVWLSNVDLAATEKANAEPAGSFAGRVVREPKRDGAAGAQEALKTERRPGRRVITNKELEPARLRREEQEKEYERTRRERGMPSRQELQQRVEEEDRRLREWARQMSEARREAELESLRYEVINVRRDLYELNLHLSRQAAGPAPTYAPPDYYPYSYTQPAQIIAVPTFGRRGDFGRVGYRPHTYVRRWPHHTRTGYPFRPLVGPFRNGDALPRGAAPSRPAPRR